MSETEIFIREMMAVLVLLIGGVAVGIIAKDTVDHFSDKPSAKKRPKKRRGKSRQGK